MKKLFFCAAALLAAISFTACSDDDDTNLPATPDTIAGTWQITTTQWMEIYEGEKESGTEKYPDEDGYYWTLAFDKNGSCVETSYEDEETYSSHYTYSISGNKLTLRNSYDSETFEIKKLTESQLVLFISEKESNDDLWEETQTYKRMK